MRSTHLTVSCSTSAGSPERVTGSALACSFINYFGRRQDGYDQSDLPDVIILKVIVSLFC